MRGRSWLWLGVGAALGVALAMGLLGGPWREGERPPPGDAAHAPADPRSAVDR